jgi:hypothetical protein
MTQILEANTKLIRIDEVFLRLTDKGLEAKKSPIPIRRMVELGLKAKGK